MTEVFDRTSNARVAVIGAAGHVGLGLSLVLADVGHHVLGVDIDPAAIATVLGGHMPFEEEQGEEFLERALASGRFDLGGDPSVVAGADVVIVIVGTALDGGMDPRPDSLYSALDQIAPHVHAGQLIILRSTVTPGTTDHVRDLLTATTGLQEGSDFHLVYAPERVVEGKCIVELPLIPQLIGAYSQAGFDRAEAFFTTYLRAGCWPLAPAEAELGKLASNVERYIRIAFANELMMIADRLGVDAHRVVSAVNRDYPRSAIPLPGPNVGGPCLPKDARFFGREVPFIELAGVADRINEGMPAYIVDRVKGIGATRVAVLGMTFKANSDDMRGSLSPRLVNLLRSERIEVACYDPRVEAHADPAVIEGVEALILMTPHREFHDVDALLAQVGGDCALVDLWGVWGQADGAATSPWAPPG